MVLILSKTGKLTAITDPEFYNKCVSHIVFCVWNTQLFVYHEGNHSFLLKKALHRLC